MTRRATELKTTWDDYIDPDGLRIFTREAHGIDISIEAVEYISDDTGSLSPILKNDEIPAFIEWLQMAEPGGEG